MHLRSQGKEFERTGETVRTSRSRSADVSRRNLFSITLFFFKQLRLVSFTPSTILTVTFSINPHLLPRSLVVLMLLLLGSLLRSSAYPYLLQRPRFHDSSRTAKGSNDSSSPLSVSLSYELSLSSCCTLLIVLTIPRTIPTCTFSWLYHCCLLQQTTPYAILHFTLHYISEQNCKYKDVQQLLLLSQRN